MILSKPSTTRYIEAAEEALETSFQALEIANASFVGEGNPTPKPRLSKASIMTAKVMLRGGINEKLGTLLILQENKNRYGLGYKPTNADKRRIVDEKKEKRLAKLENQEPVSERVPTYDIRRSFRSAGLLYPDQVAVTEEEHAANEEINLVYPCPPHQELSNWGIVEFPVIFNSASK